MTMDANISARISLPGTAPVCGMAPVCFSRLPDLILILSNEIAGTAFSRARGLPVASRG